MPMQVISKPDFKYFLVEKNFEFLILASDGLWDVFTCPEVGQLLLYRLRTFLLFLYVGHALYMIYECCMYCQ
jgi:hypothetical protein